MDKTEQYIKMCDCLEIQEHWGLDKVFEPHYVYNRRLKIIRSINRYGDSEFKLRKRNIWLPRQDQIQEMISEKLFAGLFVFEDVDIGARLSYMVGRFKDFVQVKCEKMIPLEKNRARVEYLFLSMEQLWLAFYMHEKHSKIWSSKEEKWVKK